MKADRDIINEVKQASDIVEIVQQYSQVNLKQRGQNWIGLCPFHNERTPSFNVNPDRGFFKCFGCGKSGDAFGFVMEIGGLTFGEALRTLAERANIELPERADPKVRKRRERREPLYNALRFAAEFYEEQLKHSPVAGRFLDAREFSADTRERFRIGYAPDQWRALVDAAKRKHIQPKALVGAGLVIENDKGNRYDRFRNRVVFPIWSQSNRIVGFGGRSLTPDKKSPKYINSPDSEVYRKNAVLYGLVKGRRAIRETGEVIVVEGYTDVLAMHQAGVENVVAACGTALTETHVKILGRYAKTILLIFDADQAGIVAAERALDIVLRQGLTSYVVSLPDGADPDSYVRDFGAEAFHDTLKARKVNFVRFLFNQARINRKLSTPEQKSASVQNALDKISLITDPIVSEEYLNQASQYFDVPLEQLRKWRAKQSPPKPVATLQPQQNELPPAEKDLLSVMLDCGAPLIRHIKEELNSDVFSEGAPRKLAENLYNLYNSKGDSLPFPVPAKLLEPDPAVQALASSLSMGEHPLSPNWKKKDVEVPTRNAHPERIAGDAVRTIIGQKIDAKMDEIYTKLKSATPDSEEQRQLFAELKEWLEIRSERAKTA